jgi:XapX domain-containing protein
MKPYLLSLAVGLLVGVIYGLLNVRSPAPPVIALLGLLGILAGEQVVPLVKRVASAQPVTLGWVTEQFVPHIFGSLPVGRPTSSAGLQTEEPRRTSTYDRHAS